MCRWPVLAQAGRGGAAADAGAEEARGQGQERHPLRGGRDGDPDPHHGQDIQGDTGHAGAGHRQLVLQKVAAFNQEKALVGAFSVITNLRMELFEALISCQVHNIP